MAEVNSSNQSTWWDGLTDGLSEMSHDLMGGVSSYFDSETAKANAQNKANENATVSQQARIDKINAEAKQQQQENKKIMLLGGGGILILAIVVILVLK
jgi:CRISPR/Cas system CSM-associated protein Csm5 (group 7 of RAMP superfamily)